MLQSVVTVFYSLQKFASKFMIPNPTNQRFRQYHEIVGVLNKHRFATFMDLMLNNICVLSWYISKVIIGKFLDVVRNILFESFTPNKTTWEKILCGNCFVIEYKALLFRIKSLSERSCWFIEYVVKPYYVILFQSAYKTHTNHFFTLDGHFGKAMSIY